MKKTWNLSQSSKLFERLLKIIPFTYIYQLAKFGDLMSCGSKDIQNCILSHVVITHHDVTDLVYREIV